MAMAGSPSSLQVFARVCKPPCHFLAFLTFPQVSLLPDQPPGEQARDVFAGVFCCIALVLLQLKQRGQGKYLISSTKAWLQESA